MINIPEVFSQLQTHWDTLRHTDTQFAYVKGFFIRGDTRREVREAIGVTRQVT